MSERVGVIGLGAMGSAIAIRCCQAGHEVVGFDLRSETMDELETHGGRRASGPRDVAERSDFVIISVNSAGAFHAVTTGQDSIAAAGREDVVAIDTCTLHIDDKAEAARRLADLGIVLLDCTVSGNRADCLAGKLPLYASGDEPAYRRASEVFDAFTGAHHWMGEFGNASRIKYVLNMLVCIHNAAMGEALSFATKIGLDPQQVYELVDNSAATSWVWHNRAKMAVDQDYLRMRGRYGMARKDVKIIGAYAAESECPAPLFQAAVQMHYSGLAQGFGDMDTATLYEVYKLASGLESTVEKHKIEER